MKKLTYIILIAMILSVVATAHSSDNTFNPIFKNDSNELVYCFLYWIDCPWYKGKPCNLMGGELQPGAESSGPPDGYAHGIYVFVIKDKSGNKIVSEMVRTSGYRHIIATPSGVEKIL